MTPRRRERHPTEKSKSDSLLDYHNSLGNISADVDGPTSHLAADREIANPVRTGLSIDVDASYGMGSPNEVQFNRCLDVVSARRFRHR